MKRFIVFIPFLTFLVAAYADPSVYSTSSRASNLPHSGVQYPGSRGTGSSLPEKDKDKGYKIVIKLDDAFGKAAEDFEKINELATDIKLIKVLLEEIVPDIREIKKIIPEIEALKDYAPYAIRQVARTNASRLLATPTNTTDLKIEDIWEMSVPKSNCAEKRLRGQKASGMYTIQPDRSRKPVEVHCDMHTDGGGWTVIQRRGVLDIPKAVRQNFYRNWADYENGFGSALGDYWLGLENIYQLTKVCNNELIINMTSWDGVSTYARYSTFNISGKSDLYRLHIAGYSGNAGDAMLYHNDMRFTTYDKQNDLNGDDNCAQLYKGAWWYKDCFWSNLNGEYAEDGTAGKMSTRQGIEWGSRHFYSMMKTEMKIKPKC